MDIFDIKNNWRDLVDEAVCNVVRSGQVDQPIKLLCKKLDLKEVKLIRKVLKGNTEWTIGFDKKSVQYTNGETFTGFSSWAGKITVRTFERDYRSCILNVYHLDKCTAYLIPASQKDTFKQLPGADFNPDEINIIRTMANATLTWDKVSERVIKLKHPARDELESQVSEWLNDELVQNTLQRCALECERDTTSLEIPAFEQKLFELFQRNPILWEICTSGLDAQLRALKRMKSAPQILTNFVRPKGSNLTPDQWVRDVMQAICFTNKPGLFKSGPIVIDVKEENDLQKLNSYPARLVLLNSTVTHLFSITKNLKHRQEQIQAGAKNVPHYYSTSPMAISGGCTVSSCSVDIELQKTMPVLSREEKWLLRTAMAVLLQKGVAKTVYLTWKDMENDSSHFFDSGSKLWRRALRNEMTSIWFPHYGYEAAVQTKSDEEERAKKEREREDRINHAIAILSDLNAVAERIVAKPGSEEQWRQCFKDGAVAFLYIAGKGDLKGKPLVAFPVKQKVESFRRLGISEDIIDVVLERCMRMGLIEKKDHPITLWQSVHCILFCQNVANS